MKPFDKERAIAGDPIITRLGREVTELKFFNEADRLGVSIVGKTNDEVFAFTKEGIEAYHRDERLQLFMAPKKIKGWIAIKKIPWKNGTHSSTDLFSDKQKLSEIIYNVRDEFSIHEIQIEV